MNITVFTHNDQNKKELFGWIGEACASMDVRNTLGNPITSAPGDVWMLAMDNESLQGFCALTMQKNGKAKLHAFHSFLSTGSSKIESALIREVVRQATKLGAKIVFVVDYVERHHVYETQGWKAGVVRGKRFQDYSKEVGGEK